MFDDWDLIESSFLKQYGMRIRLEDDMPWTEFCSLLSGIMPDTPLGRIVSIRCETDSKVLKNFSKEQKRIRNQWLKRKAQNLKKDTNSYNEYWANFQKFAKDAFS